MSKMIQITDADFEAEVLKSEGPVLVDFFGTWCPPCQRLMPILDQLSTEYDGKVKFVKVNTDEQSQWAGKLGVRNLPTLAYYNKGEAVTVESGLKPPAAIKKHLDQLISAG